MRFPGVKRRTLALVVVIAPLLALFVYVALRSGPLAPVPITVARVQAHRLSPALFGIGTVQARYVYRIGPTYAGRVKRVDVHVGDMVSAGQPLGEMDPVDLNERIAAQQAAIKSGEAAWRQAQAKQRFARTQSNRYERLLSAHSVSEEMVATKRQELAVANAALSAAHEDLKRLRADVQALHAQRANLSLVAPVNGLVVARDADPGTTVVAGQPVVELIDPTSLWIDTRFDQISAEGLAAGLPARIVLRSRHGQALKGHVLRVEPLADQVTEETLAKIVFDEVPRSLPPIGELAEVTLQLPQLPAAPTIPNAAIREVDGQRGVWKVEDGGLAFAPVVLGRSDLQGNVQVRKGLGEGDRVVVYSARALRSTSNIRVVDRIPGVSP
jgi:HlyD family secretion protein